MSSSGPRRRGSKKKGRHHSPDWRPIVAELRVVMRQANQSYYFMAIHYGHKLPPTRNVSKADKDSILTHALRVERARQGDGYGWASDAKQAVIRWITTYKPHLLEELALSAGDD